MWLSMLTADAAAQHGHEFSSPRRAAQPAGFHLPLPRSPLGALSASMQRGSTEPAFVPRRALLPKRSRSLRVTMAELKEVPEEIDDWDEEQIRHLSIPGAYKESSSQLRLDAMVQDNALHGTYQQSASHSPAASDPRSTAALPLPTVALARRAHRAKMHYRLAHPPPPAKSKKHLRPRVLLQLQQRTDSGFHRPSYEVLPACRFTSNTKVGARLTKLRNIAQRDGQLNSEDLVVVQVDESKNMEQAGDDADTLDSRMAIGIICAAGNADGQPPGNALIYLENAVWKATLGKAGVYDLVLQGDEEQRARWFVPRAKRQRPSSLTGLETLATAEDKKFYFTTIQPDTTKHPTVAAMTRQSLHVYDTYSRATSNSNPLGATPSDDAFTLDVATPFDAEATLSTSTMDQQTPVDDALRRLITVSSAWLFFRQGWSPFFHYSLTSSALPTTPPSVASLRSLPRSVTTPIETLKTIEGKFTDRRDSKTSTFQSIPRLVRSATSRSRSSRGPSQAETGPIPFHGFSDPTLSRFTSLTRGRSVVSPSLSNYSPSTVAAAQSTRSISPVPTDRQVANLEEVLDSAKAPSIRSSTPEPQPHLVAALRESTPGPDSPAASLSEPNTPVQYWTQYDSLVTRNMHVGPVASESSAFTPNEIGTVQDELVSSSRRASAAVSLRYVSPRPTVIPDAVFADDIFEQHAPGDRHGRFHAWAHSLYGRRGPTDAVSQPTVVATEPGVLPVVQPAPEASQSPTLSRMQTMRASLSSRMGRRSRGNTVNGPPSRDVAAIPSQTPNTQPNLAASARQLDDPASLTTTTRIITTIKTTTRPATAADGIASPPASAAAPAMLSPTSPLPAEVPATSARRRRLSRSWHRVKGLFAAENQQGGGSASDGPHDGRPASPGPRFDPGFHPRWLKGR